jgi:hypothetical protein
LKILEKKIESCFEYRLFEIIFSLHKKISRNSIFININMVLGISNLIES